ncbi:uncharacterized protein LOC123880972 isoform X2 [Maniola jurtina]|uniref:uncharacterized protein LOC123880972 isoform X2 n=1 Tax=Maniola jurtina TaxID=191418 RepID=UPI001E689FCC|nr:uncharacterized protein LOC123880972 isoform X2 [Maniola jurtina]
METTIPSQTPMRARTMAELLPGIKALLSKDTLHMITFKNQQSSSSNICQTRTNEKNKNIKPMTLAEIKALTGPTPRKFPQATTTKPKPWNSSVKVDKTKILTKDGQMKHSTVRKELNFQPKPKSAINNKPTMPAPVVRKSFHPQAKARDYGICRISGVHKIPETPAFNKPKPTFIPPREVKTVPRVKINNISFKSNDDSFIQKEKEINDFEEQSNALVKEPTLEKNSVMSPSISTPFKDYRNVRDYFNQSEADNSVLWNDNTIMSFEKPSDTKDGKREESVIVSLCEMLNKTTFTNCNNNNQELGELMEVERETENNLKMIDNVIEMLHSMKKKQFKTLQQIRKLKHKKLKTNGAEENSAADMAKENIVTHMAKENNAPHNMAKENNVKFALTEEKISPDKSPITSRPTVIKSKSPSYKIPRKSLCLRKKVFYKSMPNINSNGIQTPNKNNDKALNMYLQIKEQMTFLNTPSAKPRTDVPDTPAITSRNLQKQLDMLYN